MLSQLYEVLLFKLLPPELCVLIETILLLLANDTSDVCTLVLNDE